MRNNDKAVLVSCSSYQEKDVHQALIALLDSVGGLDWVKPGMRIGIKLNLCAARSPEAAATTHPAMAIELARLLTQRGAHVVLGDSPGAPFTEATLRHIYKVCGLEAAEAVGAELNTDVSFEEVTFSEGQSVQRFVCCSWLLRCDAIINFSKLKAHGLTGMTAAVKNLYGIIPGTRKSEYHFSHRDPADFANLLVDLNEFLRPRLCICDAVTIMEGNGPTQGTPRHLGIVAAAGSPYELDRLCTTLLGLAETEVPTLTAAKQRGLLAGQPEDYLEAAAPYRLTDFKRSGATSSWFLSSEQDSHLRKAAKNALFILLRSRPALLGNCIGCGHCATLCPAKAIEIRNKKAVIHRKSCVRCFCCQEFCPVGAMQVQRTPLARLLQK